MGERARLTLSVATFDGGNLGSRSQAKQVAIGLEQFSVVEIDCVGVDGIGPAFADELFRVWPLGHPGTRLVVANAGEAVVQMIRRVQSRIDLPQPRVPVTSNRKK